ncbi:hypothetical protein AMTRI_Chr07g24640 [Amborella trichopoda]
MVLKVDLNKLGLHGRYVRLVLLIGHMLVLKICSNEFIIYNKNGGELNREQLQFDVGRFVNYRPTFLACKGFNSGGK